MLLEKVTQKEEETTAPWQHPMAVMEEPSCCLAPGGLDSPDLSLQRMRTSSQASLRALHRASAGPGATQERTFRRLKVAAWLSLHTLITS